MSDLPSASSSRDISEPLPIEEHPAVKEVLGIRDYYFELCGIVFWRTIGFFGWNKRTLLVPLLYVAGTVVALQSLRGELVRDQLLTSLAFGLLPIGGLTVIVALINLIRAPYLIGLDRAMQAGVLRGGLIKTVNDSEGALKLVKQTKENLEGEVRGYKVESRNQKTQVVNLENENTELKESLSSSLVELETLREKVRPKVEITNVFWDQYEGVNQEDLQLDTFQLLRIELTSTEATWTQATIDNAELDGLPFRKLHLHIQHKPWNVQRTQLLPGRPDYWDVIQKASRSDKIELTHVEPLIEARTLSVANKFLFKITIACDKGFGAFAWITIERDGNELKFQWAETDDES